MWTTHRNDGHAYYFTEASCFSVSLSLTNEAITSVQEATIGPMAIDAK